MKLKFIPILLLILTLSALASCKKLIETDTPQNQLTTDKVFSDTTSAIAAMVNVYALFDRTIDVNCNKYLGLYTDEFLFPGNPSDQFYTSTLRPDNGTVLNIWKNNYFAIYACNAIIEELQRSEKLPPSTALKLSAEAKFLRAHAYFYLVNIYGAVPLLTTTDVQQTSHAARTDAGTIYQQIAKDLSDAAAALPESYSDGEKVRATKWAAAAMQARVSLYLKQWADAENYAAQIIGSGLFTPPGDVSATFKADSHESILQFWTQFGYIADGPNLIPGSGAPQFPVSAALLNSFEPGDLRKTAWLASTVANGTTYYYARKYRNRASNTSQPEYLTALRISEMYLTRAEARLALNKVQDAVADINIIRARAKLAPLSSALSMSQAQAALEQEWRIEFFAEWGNRFLALKRMGRLDAVMSSYRQTWKTTGDLFPIPQNEINFNSALTQNPGY